MPISKAPLTSLQLLAALLASTAITRVELASATELPTGASVAAGSVTISQTPSTMTMQQSTGGAVVNWQGFSVGQGGTVNIQQPSAASALLNRVTGSTLSTIAGQINANGQVYLVNPNGILITPTGVVRASGFVGSTLGISDDDFMSGKRTFKGTGNSAGVVNRGAIEIGQGGYAALIGGSIDNSGLVSVPLGKVGFGAGEQATLDSGDGFLQVAVPSISSSDGKALIQHSGTIQAAGGRVEMKAATARQFAREAINLSGVVEARSVSGRSGAIVLGGGEGGTVNVSGRLDTSVAPPGRMSKKARKQWDRAIAAGGDLTITGDHIRLSGATLDASGQSRGGNIRIGGDLKGGGTLQRATTTSVDAATRISADAKGRGDGGTVVLWSDKLTSFAGTISARGGPLGGNGGFAEVSGKLLLSYTGFTDLRAPFGRFGTLLLDPYDVYIEPGTGGSLGPPFSDNSVLGAATLMTALDSASVTVQTQGVSIPGGQAGDIIVGAPLSWSSPSILTLQADRNIIIGESITATNPLGGLLLTAGATGTITTPSSYLRAGGTTITNTAPQGVINVGTFTLGSGNWIQNASSPSMNGALPGLSATNFAINGSATFLRALSGDGGATPYAITDVYGLQGVGSLLASNFVLANDIDATGTQSWNSGSGFRPIGGDPTFSLTAFTGTFDGAGHVINGLYLSQPTGFDVGLFGYSSGTITTLGLTNVNVTGLDSVGGLVGNNFGTISRSFVTGSVTAVTPSEGSPASIGGLVGVNNGTISTAYANVNVSAGSLSVGVGGLAGVNNGSVTDAYALGPVTTGTDAAGVGGLVGTNDGTILRTYATGLVTAPLSIVVGEVGGLVGTTTGGSIQNSFWDSDTSGQSTSAGGSPLTTAQFQDMSGFMALAGAQGWDFQTTWSPPSAGHYPELYALSPVVYLLANDATRVEGTANPSFTYVGPFGGPTFYAFGPAGDSINLSAALSSIAGLTSPAGLYPIAGAATATSSGGVNYRLIAIPAALTVTPAPVIPPPIPIVPPPTPVVPPPIPVVPPPTPVIPPPVAAVPPPIILPSNPALIADASPFLDRLLPFPDVNLSNPPDTISFGLSGGGPTLGTGNILNDARTTLDSLERSASSLEEKIAQCERDFGQDPRKAKAYTTCVGNALDGFADALDNRILSLPGPMKGVSAIVRDAARKVRNAKTIAEARASVRAAVVEVRKAIALIRADEPGVAQLQIRQGNVIASALENVDIKLSKAVGL